MSSGDDIEAGRITTAESTTHIVGAIPSEQDVGFNGTVILEVGPQVIGELGPRDTLDGIHGIGSNPPMPPGIPGGVGVIGTGGRNGGTGVLGKGGGGGRGVEAFGGEGGITGAVSGLDEAGVGVFAQGGRIFGVDDDERSLLSQTNRSPHGAGVVALAGGAPPPAPAEMGNVGVFGQGGDQVSSTRRVSSGFDEVIIVLGPEFAGPGVIGRGGTTKSNDGIPNTPVASKEGGAAGVVGVAGGAPMPAPTTAFGAGVFGQAASGTGVAGHSIRGIGVVGASQADRGGTFSSGTAPQLQLIPMRLSSPAELAGDGRPGDFLVTMRIDERGTEIASLHFCTSVGSWTQLA